MKVSLKELRSIVADVLTEAKKKKKKSKDLEKNVDPKGYGYAESFDFSAPLGGYNLYRSQGVTNWGPHTGAGPKIDDNVGGTKALSEKTLRSYLRSIIHEHISTEQSSWNQLSELTDSKSKNFNNIWEAANHWYDHQNFGLGRQTSEGIQSKKDKKGTKKSRVK